MKWLQNNFFLILIIFAALLIRIIYIESVPVATTDDQLHYIIQAESFIHTGKDVNNTLTPLDILLFRNPKGSLPQAELPYFLEMGSIALLGATPFSIVLPNILLSTGTILVLYFLGKELFNKKVGYATAIIAAFNPWAIAIGRTGYEVVPATFFYCLALYIIIKAKEKYLLLALPCMLLAFYSYIGTKLLFVPFFLVSIAFTYFFIRKRKYTRYFLSLAIMTVVIAAVYLLMLQQSGNSRMAELVTPSHPYVAHTVNDLRKQSLIASGSGLFDNKLSVYLKLLLNNVLTTLSPTYLFFTGDFFYSIWNHGLFYIIDSIFLSVGIYALVKMRKITFLFLAVLLAISLLPHVFHEGGTNNTFTPHISLLFPIFYLFIGYGIIYLIDKTKRRKYITILLIGAIYLLSVVNFLHIYFTQSPFQNGIYTIPSRVMSRYVLLTSQKNRVIIYTRNASSDFANYLFYTNAYKKFTTTKINKILQKSPYTLGNVTFTSCESQKGPKNATILYEHICGGKLPLPTSTAIAQLSDSGNVYNIYHDTTCGSLPLQKYISNLTISDLNIENLSQTTFCQKFIIATQ